MTKPHFCTATHITERVKTTQICFFLRHKQESAWKNELFDIFAQWLTLVRSLPLYDKNKFPRRPSEAAQTEPPSLMARILGGKYCPGGKILQLVRQMASTKRLSSFYQKLRSWENNVRVSQILIAYWVARFIGLEPSLLNKFSQTDRQRKFTI